MKKIITFITSVLTLNLIAVGAFATAEINTDGFLSIQDYNLSPTPTYMVVDGSGQVGIGTTQPGSELEVYDLSSTAIGIFSGSANDTTPTKLSSGGALILRNRYNGDNNYSVLQFQNSGLATCAGIAGINVNHSTHEGELSFMTRPASGSLTQVMRIDSAGNVGIGATQVATALNIYRSDTNSEILTQVSGDYFPRLQLERINGNSKTNRRWSFDLGSNGDLFIEDKTVQRTVMQLQTDGDVLFNNGNVGIGTADPKTKLHVLGAGTPLSTTGATVCSFQRSESSGQYSQISIISGNEGHSVINFGDTDAEDVGQLYFDHNSNEFNIKGVNVGIGSSDPAAKLDIKQAPRTGTHPNSKALYVSGTFNAGKAYDGGIEFRHSNGSQGVGFGYNSIYATGSNTDQELNLYAKGTSHLTLNAYGGGNVGIGTTNPSSKLTISEEVNGNSNVLLVTNANKSGVNDSVSIGFGLGRSVDSYIRNVKAITFGKEKQWTGDASTVDGFLSFLTVKDEQHEEKMRLTSDGNLGIGTTLPLNTFWNFTNQLGVHIKGASGSRVIIQGGTSSAIDLYDGNAAANQKWFIINKNDKYTSLLAESDTGGVLHHFLVMDHMSGHVGIGTTQPSEKLTVKGNILVDGNLKAKEIIVANDFTVADYVFKPDYKLMSLEKVAAFTKQNQHLPNVPSEAEIKNKKGINIAEFQMKLLEKIEENYLYDFNQEQNIKRLKAENLQLKAANTELQARLSNIEKILSEMTGKPLPKITSKKWWQVWR